MKVTTKYAIEFCVDNTIEIIAVCDSIIMAEQYLNEKFNFNGIMQTDTRGYLLYTKLAYGAIRVRKVDFVEN